MKTSKKPTCQELKEARKGGFKKKAPKKPVSKSYAALENWVARWNQWVVDARIGAAKGRKFEDLKKAVRNAGR